jgi:hypothetical protein
MTCRREPRQAENHDRNAETAAKRICHRLFTFEQASDFADEPIQQIWRWIITRQLQAYRLTGGDRIDELELAELLSTRQSNQP